MACGKYISCLVWCPNGQIIMNHSTFGGCYTIEWSEFLSVNVERTKNWKAEKKLSRP